jgi:iron complex transport system substrate-binding protein
MPTLPRIGALTALAVSLAACGVSAQPPAAARTTTLTSCGEQITVTRPPSRVVTLDQSATELLLTLGVHDRIAGTSNHKTPVPSRFRAAYERIPVLNPKIITSEQLRAAGPDLAFSPFASLFTKDRAGTRDELHALGLPTYVSAVDCPDGTADPFELLFQDYTAMGRIFGVEERARALVEEQRAVIGSVRKAEGRPKVVWLYSMFNGIPYVAGHGGIPSAMSRVLGAENAFDDVDELWPEVTWEEIARRDPDVIVVGDLSERGRPGDSAEEKIAKLRDTPVAAKLPAVRDSRFITVPGIEMDPSVRSVDTLQLVAKGLRDHAR